MQGEEMLEALQAHRVKPGKAVQFVNRSNNNSCRLVLESCLAVQCHRVSYRSYDSSHDRLSGTRTSQITWLMFLIFNAETAFVYELTSTNHETPPFPSKKDLKLLASNAKKLPADFRRATDTEIARLWADLKVWTRL